MKEKFNIIDSTCVPLPLENVDTDQIIPARFLKATDKEGFGDNLFRDWRYNPDGTKKDFVLNDPTYGGQILVAGKNFGCGSSREHAAWAIAGYGFRVVVSSFFADIHKQNELNNFVLPVVVSEAFLSRLFADIKANPQMHVVVNLPEQTITNTASGETEHFDINGYKKYCLMEGLDDIDFLIRNQDKTEAWEQAGAC
ncbi:MAG: 3-isopropylmalate dehydratase small subunit [Alloprevotella sp.]|nr:3-isopropylmalate dehydratase small subunit [Bacteroidales bacterium]MDY2606001.1 3-isopropylmalate dehydratase small subunit [Alloprevotella sp.]MCI6252343.1 3-isopropylmalate dehydratase small subunit [Bacteroidales bacterium]MCI7646001.1 3-isopropylmalate dehydratase small subunit [Bacteroidales bacterium]MDY4030701.1 3-isopropylmalate dehydratase small subunit [Alloprevotella sp.]